MASPNHRRAPSLSKLKTGAAISFAAFMAACATAPAPGPTPAPVPPPRPPPPPGAQVRPRRRDAALHARPADRARRPAAAVLARAPKTPAALYNAAELALFDHGDQNTLLIPRDAGADEASANAAARALVSDGADIIVGPVLREGVQAQAKRRGARTSR